MKTRLLLASAAAIVIASTVVYAQSRPTAPTTGAASSNYYNVQQGQDWLAYELLGTDIMNNQEENIGEVADIVIDPSGKVRAVVASVGGFLGVGERHVAVSWDALKIGHDKNGDMTAMLNTTKEELKNAPEYKYQSDEEKASKPVKQ